MSTTVLLADREPGTRGLLERRLPFDGFELVTRSGRRPDLVIAGDDAEIARWCGEAPVIALGSAEAPPDEPVRAFRQGCDDYVSRPFQYDELVERIRAVLRRVSPPERALLVAGPIEIDVHARLVRAGGSSVRLAQKEYALLVRLAVDPARVLTKAELLRDVWGYETHIRTRTLDSHASRLRRKLRAIDPVTPFVENVWGVGYRLLGMHGP